MDLKLTNALSGAGMGASLGSSFGPWGTVSGVVGGGILGAALGPEEQSAVLPPMVDPTQVKILEDLYAKKRSIEMGTSTEFQTGREIIARSEATALSNVARITGGDVSSAVSAAERIVEASGDTISKMVGQAGQLATPYMSMIQEATDKMAQRRLELGMVSYSQNMAENAAAKESANANLSAVLSSTSLLDSLKSLGGAVAKGIKGSTVTPTTSTDFSLNPAPSDLNLAMSGGTEITGLNNSTLEGIYSWGGNF